MVISDSRAKAVLALNGACVVALMPVLIMKPRSGAQPFRIERLRGPRFAVLSARSTCIKRTSRTSGGRAARAQAGPGSSGSLSLLALGERLPEKLNEVFRGTVHELMELSRGSAPTVFRARFKKKPGWHAGATMNHIMHNAVWLYMGEGTCTRDWPREGCNGSVGSRSRYCLLCLQ